MTDLAALEGMDGDKFPELFHYTTGGGIKGILMSRRLHATHIEYLNDASEKFALLDSKLLSKEIDRMADLPRSHFPKFFSHFDDREFKQMARKLFKAGLEQISEMYVTSLSIPDDKSRDDGLLSQWRGYGPDGGYAIVFDTAKLQHLLELERDVRAMEYADINSVRYLDESSAEEQTFGLPMAIQELMKAESIEIEKLLGDESLDGESVDQSMKQDFATYLLKVFSSLHKHSGFSEECEARIVAIPDRHPKAGDNRPQKTRHFREKNGLLVPYIELFDGLDVTGLPIERIIIGPHPEYKKRQRAIQLLLDELHIQAKVTPSQIPYIGR